MMYREYTLQDIGHLSDIYLAYRTSSVLGHLTFGGFSHRRLKHYGI